MTTKERLHELVDELPESEVEPVVEFIVSREANGADDAVDDWGNLDATLDGTADDQMTDLDEEEIATSGETLADAWAEKGHGPR